MYLTTQFPAFGFDQFWVSPPEYFEFREINQSFSRRRRVHDRRGQPHGRRSSACASGRPRWTTVCSPRLACSRRRAGCSRKGETDLTGPPPTPGSPPVPLPPIVILSHELWQTAFGGQNDRRADRRGQRPAARSHRHHAARRRRDGQPHRDLDAARTQSRQPAEPRQPLPLSDRPAQGRRDAAAGADRADGADPELGRARRREAARVRAAARRSRRTASRTPAPATSCR